MPSKKTIAPAEGKLGVLLPGMGAVGTTFIAGVEAIKKNLGKPVGSLTQLARIRLGKRSEKKNPLIKEFLPLAGLEDIVFGGWDCYDDNAYEAAKRAGVLDINLLEKLKPELSAITPWKAAFDPEYVKNLDGTNVLVASRREMSNHIGKCIDDFMADTGVTRCVMVWCGSTEVFKTMGAAHSTMETFEKAIDADDKTIAPSMLYAYEAIKRGIPFSNGAPNLTVDTPALLELAMEKGVPVCGKDYKTGQTWMKTVISPGIKTRHLGINGWFSTNILGNRDGEVLDDPEAFKTKEESKLSVLDSILQPEQNPELYGDMYHKVRINYYPPRGDDKEGWDNIDIFGWLGYPMQIKIDFLCKDSILAAPLVLDLALFTDLAKRAGMKGIQEWLSFYFKSPQCAPEVEPVHDLFQQEMKLKNTLRWMMGEDQITHLGVEYYGEEA